MQNAERNQCRWMRWMWRLIGYQIALILEVLRHGIRFGSLDSLGSSGCSGGGGIFTVLLLHGLGLFLLSSFPLSSLPHGVGRKLRKRYRESVKRRERERWSGKQQIRIRKRNNERDGGDCFNFGVNERKINADGPNLKHKAGAGRWADERSNFEILMVGPLG